MRLITRLAGNSLSSLSDQCADTCCLRVRKTRRDLKGTSLPQSREEEERAADSGVSLLLLLLLGLKRLQKRERGEIHSDKKKKKRDLCYVRDAHRLHDAVVMMS